MAVVDVLDAGLLAELGVLQPELELSVVAVRGLGVGEDADEVSRRHVGRGCLLGEALQRLDHAVQLQRRELVKGLFQEHWFSPFRELGRKRWAVRRKSDRLGGLRSDDRRPGDSEAWVP